MSDVCVIGLWHQGVVGAACLADLGHDVVAADSDAARVARLAAGRAPLFEPGLDDLVAAGLAAGRLRFTTDVAGAARGRPYVLLMFDTPVNERDESDLGEVLAAAAAIAPGLAPDAAVLVTAQVPVGTCDRLAGIMREKSPHGRFGIAYSPENLRLGQAIERFRHPALPVLGGDAATLARIETLLAPLGARWERVSLRTAEMVKHALNAFLAVSVCFGNELGNLCDEVGADGQRVAEVLRLEPRVGPKAMLTPGLGFSGGTLARDVQTLRGLGDRTGLDTALLDGAWQANLAQNRLVVRKLAKVFGSLRDVPVAVLGLTYKPDTSTLRRSAALEIIADMTAQGARIAAHDPRADRDELARHPEFRFCDDPYAAATGARALVIVTAWPEYRELDLDRLKRAMAEPVIIDTANMLDAERATSKGFRYLDVGRGRTAGGAL
ncbi:MAG: UDP-glucose/GDP-mannose dehydrogenase family protein [Candidatus Rokubacteria bacterium]|nr:UDP-glucose/GDP-mannose dehydrogenase family protein [Candidatus Rokubacteria bacterium]